MGRTSRETWAKRVERWKESGLTAGEFATEMGISAHSLSWWKWRLAADARRGGNGEVTKRRRRRRTTRSPSPLTFVELPAPGLREALEVILESGVRIRVPIDFDTATLGRLVEVLGARR